MAIQIRSLIFKSLFYGLVLLLCVLLFVGGANEESSRLEKAIWDSGHLFLFAGLALILMQGRWLQQMHLWSQLLIVIALALLVGIGVEFIQLYVGRYFELQDVLFDFLGALTCFLVFYILHNSEKLSFALMVSPLIMLALVIVFQPVYTAYRDEQKMRGDFPVLADFESLTEISRWQENDVQLFMQKTHVRHGKSALAINFLPAQYPGISLHEMVGEWGGFKSLEFSLYNVQDEVMTIELKIYDRQHPANGYKYSDRFNKEIPLQPGWNDISVALSEVRQAPENREMDMDDIYGLSLFLDGLEKPALMFFDYMRLSR